MPRKLNIAFLWHMHQPYYRDPKTGKYALPWVRLHALKGYTDMMEAVHRFGGQGITFNLVPCLLKQLSDLASGAETDHYYDVASKPAAELDQAEKRLMLRHFFSANHANLVFPFPRYRELLYRRGNQVDEESIASACKRFSRKDLLDLQVWFNLIWFGWTTEERFPIISELKRKDRGFSEEEKNQLLQLQLEVLGEVIPRFRDAWEKGIIEVSTTPFYHPILPLIIDNRAARISQPDDPMPELDYHRREDAQLQLQRGRKYIEENLGQAPAGLWPSEGSVSPATCELAGEAGFTWLASDENVLQATLPNQKRDDILYCPYLTENNGPIIFFRDQFLSDAIGFRYAGNPPEKSVGDFLKHLLNIASASKKPEEKIVSIILDGENAWEYFSDGGRRFLKELYGKISQHNKLKLTTFRDYALEHPPKQRLPAIFPASWIGGTFRIWIGDPVKNRAWDLLAETAAVLENEAHTGKDTGTIDKAREWLLTAEGSDWFWWYGEPNSSDFDEEFDYLFRASLMQVYRQLGLAVPDHLTEPIREEGIPVEKVVLFPIDPVIDGRETYYYEWSGARVVHASDFSGSMNFSSSMIERLFYGISNTHFFLRIDAKRGFFDRDKLEIIIQFCNEVESAASIRNLKDPQDLLVNWLGERPPTELPEAALSALLEVKIPFANLTGKSDQFNFTVVIKQDNLELERWPREGGYNCPFPSDEYLRSNWMV